jgi:2-oxoisovalerate dehydrogenase E1 component
MSGPKSRRRAGPGHALGQETVEITYREAVKQAIRDAMIRDERVFLMGEDVGAYGGCYAVTKG